MDGGVDRSEVRVVEGATLAVRAKVPKIAVRYVIPVRVVPRAVDSVNRGCDRVQAQGEDCTPLGHVAPKRNLERGLAVSVYVPREAAAWVPVFPERHAVDLVVVACWYPRRGVHVLRGNQPLEDVVPQAVIERQAFDRPLILRVEPEVLVVRPLEIGSGPLRDARGHPVVERVRHVQTAADDRADVLNQLLELEPGLEGMAAGHVRRREALRPARHVLDRVDAPGGGRVIGNAERRVRDRDVGGLDAENRL